MEAYHNSFVADSSTIGAPFIDEPFMGLSFIVAYHDACLIEVNKVVSNDNLIATGAFIYFLNKFKSLSIFIQNNYSLMGMCRNIYKIY